MRRSKRILALLIGLLMLLAMIPAGVQAETISSSEEVTLYLYKNYSRYFLDIDQQGGYEIRDCSITSGSLPKGMDYSYSMEGLYLTGTPTQSVYTAVDFRCVLTNGTVINHTAKISVYLPPAVNSKENIMMTEGKSCTIYLNEASNDAQFRYCQIISGSLPPGIEMRTSEVDGPYLVGTPTAAGQYQAVVRCLLYDEDFMVEHTVNITVEGESEEVTGTSSESVELILGQYSNVYLNDPIDIYTTTYESCYVESGFLPAGISLSWGEGDGPRLYGTPTEVGTFKVLVKCKHYGDSNIASHVVYIQVINPSATASNPFRDVDTSDYYYDPVLWAVNHYPQVTNGTSTNTFSPTDPCTRGQVVTFLWRAAGEPEPAVTSNPFTDVSSDAYYYKAVLWAVGRNITKGTSDTTFSPSNPCTRGQVVTFLHRTAGEPSVSAATNPFTDVASSAFYYDAVLWAVNHDPQVTNGTSDTTFSPDATCNRGQIVTFLYRAFSKMAGYTVQNVLSSDDFLFYVTDTYTVTGRGPVIVGRVVNGRVDVGDQMELRSYDKDTRNPVTYTVTVEGIEMFRKSLDYAEKNDNVGILLSGVDKSQINLGDAFVSNGSSLKTLTSSDVVTGIVEMDSSTTGTLSEGGNYQFYYGSAVDVTTTILELPSGSLKAGQISSGVKVTGIYYPSLWYVGQSISIRLGGRTYGTFTVTGIAE